LKFSGGNVQLSDTQILAFGNTADVSAYYDDTKADLILAGGDVRLSDTQKLTFGDVSDAGIAWNGTTLALDGTWSLSGADIKLSDTQQLQIGNSADFTITHNATNTVITSTTGKITVSGAGADIMFSDTVQMQFGDAGDAKLVWDGIGLKLLGLPTSAPSDAGSYLFVSDAGGNTLRIASA